MRKRRKVLSRIFSTLLILLMRNNALCAAYRTSIIKIYKIAMERAWENYRHEIYDVKNIIVRIAPTYKMYKALRHRWTIYFRIFVVNISIEARAFKCAEKEARKKENWIIALYGQRRFLFRTFSPPSFYLGETTLLLPKFIKSRDPWNLFIEKMLSRNIFAWKIL